MSSGPDDTIIAQASPQGSGAVALIRLSGPRAFSIIDCIGKFQGKTLSEQSSHTIHYGWILDQHAESIDQVLCSIFRAPRTFTGEDLVEITCHNNQIIIQTIIEQAISQGARLAQPGEFTRRAVIHEKIDILQAEAINELIHSQTQMALKKSLAQLKGSMSEWITSLERDLTVALAWCEASFEFLDDESEFGKQIAEKIDLLLQSIRHTKKIYNTQQLIRQGARIALIGAVNAGKSSLFNRLLQQQRSIVTNIAGTTRDSIEAGLYRNGQQWTLIDTAGLRQTEDYIEQEGIKRSQEQAHTADLILLIQDGSRQLTLQEQEAYNEIIDRYPSKILRVFTKIDCVEFSFQNNLDSVAVSSLTGSHCDVLENIISQRISLLFSTLDSPFLLNQRHLTILTAVEKKLILVLELLKDFIHYELVSYHLRDTLEQLSELTGKSISEAALDTVFKEFCVGK
jgi:tRNA modification GTPase